MRILTGYLVSRILFGLLLSSIVLLVLFSFLDLVDQLDDVGKGNYNAADAFLYVVLTTPRRFIQLSPFIALIGNVIGLGLLATHHELIIMRASGMSPYQISMASLSTGVVLVVTIALMEQFVAPPLQHQALVLRAGKLEQYEGTVGELGIWTRNENQILKIAESGSGNIPGRNAIEIIVLGDDGFLREYIYAGDFRIINRESWQLIDVIKKTISSDKVTTQHLESMSWEPFLESRQISTLSKPPESLSPTELYDYVRHLKLTGQTHDAYSLALWKKIGGGLTTLAMMLLSVSFVFGSPRTGLGKRLVMAGLSGIGIYLFDQLVSNTGLVIGANPPLVAILPGLVLLMLAMVLLKKVA